MSETSTDNEVLTIPEVARLLKVDPRTARRYVEAGTIHGVKVGRSWRVLKSEIYKILRSEK